ncbi:Rdx family protein [Lacihabitans soyangensis]|uniref:Uncharacterized protein n=1 Tax=Lacihabitans soyangensis TaxID=869394 RepID=A0AAE3KXT6_9BACT|nr:hypothetical protein [Lacihabitans soyangensis]
MLSNLKNKVNNKHAEIEVLLMPSQTIGKFERNVDKNVVFDRKDYGGFMDKKQEIRIKIAPELSL